MTSMRGKPRADPHLASRPTAEVGQAGTWGRSRTCQAARGGLLTPSIRSVYAPDERSLTLLGLLEREPSHGYDLKRDYDTYFGRGKPLPFGQVYATLARLTRDGKVVPGDVEPGAGPDRKRYAITDIGTTRGGGVAGRAGRRRAAPADGAVRQGRPGADAGPPGRALPRHPAGRPPAADAGADRAQAVGQPGRRAAGRSRPVPSRSRSALDRHDRGPPRRRWRRWCGHERRPSVRVRSTARRGSVIEARDVQLSFGADPGAARRQRGAVTPARSSP